MTTAGPDSGNSRALISSPVFRRARDTALFLLFGGAVLAFFGFVDLGQAAFSIGVVFGLVMFVSVDPNTITELSAGLKGFSMKRAVAEAETATAQVVEEDEKDDSAPEGLVSSDSELIDLRRRLEAKLSYIAGRMGLDTGLVMIGSLWYDGYLTDEEAATADRILHLSESELRRAKPAQRQAFLDAGEDLVGSIRARVLSGAIRKQLDRLGWKVEFVGNTKRDLQARRAGQTVRVVPLFAVSSDSDLPGKAVGRLEEVGGADRRIVVLPMHSKFPATDPAEDPAVVTLDELSTALA